MNMDSQYLYTDLSTTELSSDATALSGYPLSNLLTYDPRAQWRADSTTEIYLQLDLGAPVPCNAIVLHHHNLAGMTDVYLRAANNEAFNDSVAVAAGLTSSVNPAAFNFDSAFYQYWRLYFQFSGTVQLGQVFLGNAFKPPFPYVYPYEIGAKEFNTSVRTSITGIDRAAQSYGGKRRINISYETMPNVFDTEFKQFFNKVSGRLYPFYFVDGLGSAYFVRFERDYNAARTRRHGLHNLPGVSMIEVYPQ